MNRPGAFAAIVCLAIALLSCGRVHAQSCNGDINGDGQVSASDLPVLLNSWGVIGSSPADVDGDGFVGPSDLSALLAAWGTACSPAIDSVSPSAGAVAGGTVIEIRGTGLAGVRSVTVGGTPATSVVVVNPTTVTAVTPAGTAGARDVVVTTSAGNATLVGGFLYATVGSWATILEQSPDPAVVTNAALRSAIIATGYPWRVRDNGTGIEMLLVPPGTFDMGCIQGSNSYGCSSWEQPVHAVTLTNAYYIGRYEVTQAQWQAKMGSNPSSFQGQADSPSRPVEQVSWNTIQGFLSATGLRLPTEAEWEYACRAGTPTPFHSGPGCPTGTTNDSLVVQIAWYNSCCGGDSGGQTHAVGGKAANALGVHDMLGNVWEWCNDWYGDYSPSPQTNPAGPASGSSRVLRGGSWGYLTSGVRSSGRVDYSPDGALNVIGFRVARAPQ